MTLNLILKFFISIFWIRFYICRFFFRIFNKFSFCFFRPKPNLRVNALNLKGIEWLLKLGEDYVKNLKKMQSTLSACSLMEVDIDKNVEFRIRKSEDAKSAPVEVKDPSWSGSTKDGKRVLETELAE